MLYVAMTRARRAYADELVTALRTVLRDEVDFDRLRQCEAVKLFISATNVRTGKIKVFGMKDLSAEVLLASACLPLLFRAVEIEGEHYWDGGFMGNPAIFPLLHECSASDIVLVEVNPLRTERVPTTAREILDRNGLSDVPVHVSPGGALSDHYDPRKRALFLSEPVYAPPTVAAAAVAAHETGHALQHAAGYAPLRVRSAMFPAVAFASSAWIWLFSSMLSTIAFAGMSAFVPR